MKRHNRIAGSLGTALFLTLSMLAAGWSASDENESAYLPIFNGQDLQGWDGDPEFWRVENGALIGETTPAHQLEHSTYILWKKRRIQNFELKLEFRLEGGNSGIQYRTLEGDGERWTDARGYQADLDADDKWTGILYECGMRRFLALRGQKVVIEEDGKSEIVGTVGDREKLEGKILRKGWNEYHIIARGDHLVHLINGQVMVDVRDRNATRIKSGYLGFQLHQGPPMKIEFKNIRLKEYPQAPGEG
ncbi:MAG: DUF1080 domain-containing protein [Verrucomicrobiales bacterium]